MSGADIESVLAETRTYPPDPHAVHVRGMDAYRRMHERALADPDGFWGEIARELSWSRPFTRVVGASPPAATWFEDGETNLCANALDRHVDAGRGDAPALVWEGEPGDERTLSYRELLELTCRMASVLRSLGVKRGDRVAISMPMVPELAAAMLACARIGAVHTVIFGGFSAQAVRDRVEDARAEVVVTADGGWRRGREVALKPIVDEAIA
jgi:acetyl-CoA synthetase